MRTPVKRVFSVVLLAGALSLSACSVPFPEPPASVGADYPSTGIPASVAWPSDWLESYGSEAGAIGALVVSLRLEYIDEAWVWRVRAPDPARDILGETITESDRGRESLIDASTLREIQSQSVTLTAAELDGDGLNPYNAAQLSGETSPCLRLVELERLLEGDETVWEVTTYDTDTGAMSRTTGG